MRELMEDYVMCVEAAKKAEQDAKVLEQKLLKKLINGKEYLLTTTNGNFMIKRDRVPSKHYTHMVDSIVVKRLEDIGYA